MSQWSPEEFEDIFSNIRKELYQTDFFEKMRIENVEMFLHLLAEKARVALRVAICTVRVRIKKNSR